MAPAAVDPFPSLGKDDCLLEITLISAQDLKKPSPTTTALRRVHAYAIAWADSSTRLRTSVDRGGGLNPTWNDRFLFRIPAAALALDSPFAIQVEIFAHGYLVDTLLGTVRFLPGTQKLLDFPPGHLSCTALGVRRPSGRVQGALNLGMMVLPMRQVSAVAAEALARSGATAVGYRDLMGENGDPWFWWRRPPLSVPSSPARMVEGHRRAHVSGPLKEYNWQKKEPDAAEEENVAAEDKKEGPGAGGGTGGVLCWLGFPRKIHLSPSDLELHLADQENSR